MRGRSTGLADRDGVLATNCVTGLCPARVVCIELYALERINRVSRTVLVVDDDARLRNRLSAFLQREGYDAHALSGGGELRAFLKEGSADLVVLDLVMPGEDGLSLTRYLRENFTIGILILTGKGEPVDRIVGLEMGADDYLTKPFNLRELLARVRSISRRIESAGAAAPVDGDRPADTEILAFDEYRMDIARRRLTWSDGTDVSLTGTEFDLLVALAKRAGRPLSRDRLLDTVGNRDWQPFDRSIDLHISHLRKKLEKDPRNPSIIKTVRNVGYVLSCPVERMSNVAP